MSVELRIERLVLEGVQLAPDGRRRLQAALETRLAERLAAGGAGAGGALAAVRAPRVTMARDPERFGAELGDAVYAALQERRPA